jgi:hypothetical protein
MMKRTARLLQAATCLSCYNSRVRHRICSLRGACYQLSVIPAPIKLRGLTMRSVLSVVSYQLSVVPAPTKLHHQARGALVDRLTRAGPGHDRSVVTAK